MNNAIEYLVIGGIYLKKFKKFLYKILCNKYFKDFQPLLLVVIMFLVMISIKRDFKWSDLTKIEIGLSVIIPAFVGALLVAIVQILSRSLEDIQKIEFDYHKLYKIYKDEKCLNLFLNNQKFIIPYVSIYENINKKTIEIKHFKDKEYSLPIFFQIHYKELMSFHKYSYIENNNLIRLDKIEETNNALCLETSVTTYYNSLLTNRTMDGPLGKHLTVRKVFEYGSKLTPLEKSKLSNHIGFSVLIITSDGYLILSKRTNKTSISKNKLASSATASLKFKYAIDEDGNFTSNGLIKGVKKEIYKETGIDLDDFNVNFSIEENLIGLARDLTEGGKPNFFFVLELPLIKKEILKFINISNITNTSEKINKYYEVEKLIFLKEELFKPYGLCYLKVTNNKFKLFSKKYELTNELMTSMYYYLNIYKVRNK